MVGVGRVCLRWELVRFMSRYSRYEDIANISIIAVIL
jgi:hypothetical protein